MKTFYQMSGEDTMKQLNGSAEPLTESQVKEQQEKYGRNELVEGKKKTVLQIFLEQYKDFLVIILIIAAIASGFMGDVESTAVILIVITMNAILGTVQTVKAEQSLASLKKLSGPEAKVLRNGTVIPIPSSEVTVGDIVMLYKIIHEKLSKGAYRKRKSAFAFFILRIQGGISHEIKRHRINFSGHQRQSKQVYDRDL